MKRQYVYVLAVIVILGGISFFLLGEATVVSADTVVNGNYNVDKKVVMKNGASLTVNGDLSVSEKITCENGPIELIVQGDAVINGSLECSRSDDLGEGTFPSGITLVVKGALTFGPDARVISNGTVQIVREESRRIGNKEELEELFRDAGEDVGPGPRLGPFVSGGSAEAMKDVGAACSPIASSERGECRSAFRFIPVANAQEPRDDEANAVPSVVIGGKWYIGNGGALPGGVSVPKPPKKVQHILLNFDFGDNDAVELRNFYLAGPRGRDGTDDVSKGCNARGSRGEDAFRMRVRAANIVLNNFTLELGDGGKGGNAETTKDCDHGRATGGDGGEAGNFKMTALGQIQIQSFTIIPGRGGNGGNAIAYGKDGKPGCKGNNNGGDATATGGKGGANKKELAAVGAVAGAGNITVNEVVGGFGGQAESYPGKGGAGEGCGCKGGNGGKGTATGGDGGSASAKIPGVSVDAKGGSGGDVSVEGGAGGPGGSCGSDKKGGDGGKGGDAKGKEGQAGKGTTSDGEQGVIENEAGGNGGNGGDGCGPGAGGAGGAGDPQGENGKPGKNLCVDKKTRSQTAPQDERKIKAINYQGKHLPVDQLIVENEVGCGADHWHALEGVVRATDGTLVSDPGPQCGYGKVKEHPVIEVPVI
ncbi:hypothetical protein C4571_03825 [Candidatus Parcubacteria bacterium]|nr:MAG: hypothetical protein C4571_03825 [Candidatus Parcubacteria bacterium]